MVIGDRPTPTEEVSDTYAGQRPGHRRHGRLRVLRETVLVMVVTLALAVVLKAFFVQAFYIPSESMEPGLVKNDRIVVEKWSYWRHGEPRRGDVVVFADPSAWLGPESAQGPTTTLQRGLAKVGLYPSGGHLVKRVIGVTGDVVVCCDEQGRVSVNGTPLDEPYLKNASTCNGPMVNSCQEDWRVGPVPEGELFVMGDHRDNSADSSWHLAHGGDVYVPIRDVVGKVVALVWPLSRAHTLHRPAAFAPAEATVD